jgi:hypothetical protein
MFPITRACDDGMCQSVYVMDLIMCPVLSCACWVVCVWKLIFFTFFTHFIL